jgi:signal transduction histidine kinase
VQLFIAFFGLILIILVFFLILSKQEKEKIEFFHVMAHRFRSPIAIIRWNLELLSDGSVGDLNDKQKEYFSEISNASDKLNDVIDSTIVLLQLQSKNLQIKIEQVNIKNLIGEIVQKLQFKIKRHGLHLQEIYPKEQEILIQADPKLLNIVIQNLLENAIRYTPKDGNIDISLNLLAKNILIKIKDDGYGIPKHRRSRVLADSVSSKDMGFSLYLIKLILKKMKANINFKSEENKGTTFSILLPIQVLQT